MNMIMREVLRIRDKINYLVSRSSTPVGLGLRLPELMQGRGRESIIRNWNRELIKIDMHVEPRSNTYCAGHEASRDSSETKSEISCVNGLREIVNMS